MHALFAIFSVSKKPKSNPKFTYFISTGRNCSNSVTLVTSYVVRECDGQ